MGSRDDYAARLLKYMADMGMSEAMTDQEQNQTMRLVAQFAERERKHIRRAIAPALKGLRLEASSPISSRSHAVMRLGADAIDRATRAPKRRSRGWKAAQATGTAKATP